MANEDQRRRQSAEMPTAADEAARAQIHAAAAGGKKSFADGARRDVLAHPVTREVVAKARHTLMEYKRGKANLEKRVIENERWYRMRHWETLRKAAKQDGQLDEPVSGWLFNAIANKHADALDAFPEANVLPREEGDKPEAQMLSDVIPVVLDHAGFEKTYSRVWDAKLIGGTGVYGVFWDSAALNGLGDVSVQAIDILNIFWQPGITDIQDSANVFCLQLADNEALVAAYPQLDGRLGSQTVDVAKYVYDDTVDTSSKSVVVDWYYRRRGANGQTLLHYCKFVNDEILFSSENSPEYGETGWYAHGKYPFVLDAMFSMPGTPCGFGIIDVGKSAQEYIDRGNALLMKSLMVNAQTRHFVRADGSVNIEEYADYTNEFVHVNGNLGDDAIKPIPAQAVPSVYVNIIDNKINELKEVTGNRDVNTGGSASGVTAASAIAALQESGSKLSRASSKSSYRAFREVVYMVIELIRQFYDLPRSFRIVGERGVERFVQYSNAGIVPQPQGVDMGVDMGYRIPQFDLEITAQKQSPYSKMAQNELALQLYNAGFFNPQMADQALACLDMMDFGGKEEIMQRIAQNGTLMQQVAMLQNELLRMAQIVDRDHPGANTAQIVSEGIMGGAAPQADTTKIDPTAADGEVSGGEATVTRKARERVAESTVPR